jgi:putative FmdB family regulatory protein
MPVYAYICPSCGPFEQRRPSSEASESASCPACQSAAIRKYTAPNLFKTPPALAAALLRSEKSAHEPEVVRRPASRESRPAAKPRVGQGRPWQIGH